MINKRTELRILQYNLRKSKTMIEELFQKENIRDIDIIAIQEPWRRHDGQATAQPDK